MGLLTTTHRDAPAPVPTARRGVRASALARVPAWVWPAGAGAGVAAATAALAFRSPHVQGSWGFCPFLAVTGMYCPACGGLRAVHELTRGDVAGALEMNAPVVVGLPVVAALWVWWLLASLGRAPTTGRLAAAVGALTSARAGWVVLALATAFTVLRNVPGFEALAPG